MCDEREEGMNSGRSPEKERRGGEKGGNELIFHSISLDNEWRRCIDFDSRHCTTMNGVMSARLHGCNARATVAQHAQPDVDLRQRRIGRTQR